MFKNPLILFVAAAMFLASCAAPVAQTENPTEEFIQPTAKPALENWTINFSHSGGIMGMLRSMSIYANGDYTINDERAGRTIQGSLSEEELAQVNQFLNNFNFEQPQTRPDMTCADCFIFGVEIQTPNEPKPYRAAANDLTIHSSALEPLITLLRGIMDRELNQ